ncbi:MAG: alpha/beta fold hydrolase [Nanoarchaeota archaeon]
MVKVSFYNSTRKKLVGLLELPKQKNPSVVVMMHGLKGHKTYYSFMNYLAQQLVKNGYATFRFDFNTHGESWNDWKHFTRRRCAEDFKAALAFIRRQPVDPQRIGVFTTSMGADAFILAPQTVKAAVLHNPFILSKLMKDWIQDYEKENRKRGYIQLNLNATGEKLNYGLSLLEESLHFKPEPYARRVRCPTLLIFGDEDAEHLNAGKDTYQLFNCEKKMEIIKGMEHWRTTPEQNKMIAKLSLEWFKKHLI